MTQTVGYLINYDDGLEGIQGIGYDYILAGNGVFIQAESSLLRARVRVASAEVRGLAKVDEKVELAHGLVPGELFDKALRLMKLAHPRELFCVFVWRNGGYEVKLPNQTIHQGSVRYEPVDNVAMEVHSHGRLSAFFSGTDDADEKGFRVYGVCGKLREGRPEVTFRVGIYGHFAPVSWPELFKGPAPAVTFTGPFGDDNEILPAG